MHFRCLLCDYIVLSKSKLGASTATPVFTTAASERFVNSLIQSFSTMLAGLAITFCSSWCAFHWTHNLGFYRGAGWFWCSGSRSRLWFSCAKFLKSYIFAYFTKEHLTLTGQDLLFPWSVWAVFAWLPYTRYHALLCNVVGPRAKIQIPLLSLATKQKTTKIFVGL